MITIFWTNMLMDTKLKQILNRLYKDFDFNKHVLLDPIEFPHRYSVERDIEIIALISALFAYGQVGVFKAFLERLILICAESPYDFIESFNLHKDANKFKGLKYRFNTTKDIVCLFYVLSRVIKTYGGLKELFYKSYENAKGDIVKAEIDFIDKIMLIDTSIIYGNNEKPYGFRQLFCSPKTGSACKRLNLFLRWMVRDKDVDFGLWSEIPKNKLIIPLDVHIGRISKCIGLTTRSSTDLKMALEITNNLKKFDDEDPLKYDFALCHRGISKVCSALSCENCMLKFS
ncbi:MAG: TIGR02757 family protein [Thermodesulfovibrionales bacterium]|nr:TIGR02757 family protein [Thermodesulfovibrionales bacterium]